MRPAVLLTAVAALGAGWWLGRSGIGAHDGAAQAAVARSAATQGVQRRPGPVPVDGRQAEPSGLAPVDGRPSAQEAARSPMPGKSAVDGSPVAREAQGQPVASVRPAIASTDRGGGATAPGRPEGGERAQGSSYQPEPVRQGLDLQPQLGVRIRSGVDMAFSFDPQAYRDGAMHLINEVGRPVVVTFYGSGCSELRVNGQPVSEGRAYLVGSEAVVRGSQTVGVEVRKPTGAEGEPLPAGAG